MPHAFTLRLDPISTGAVEDMVRILATGGIDADLRQPDYYPPHITLALYPDEVAGDVLCAAFAQVTPSWRRLALSLCGFGVFPPVTSMPASLSVLWVAPVVTRELLALQATVSDALLNLPLHAHYRPGAWVPHVTLLSGIDNPGRALAVLLPRWQSVAGFLDRAELVRFPPVEVLASHTLALDQ
jgi:2'-5' RNA ligase